MPTMDSQEPFDGLDANRKGFWRKLSAWLQPWKRHSHELTEQMLRQGDEASGTSRPGAEVTWPRRRTSQLGRLEEGFDKLVSLVDVIDQHIQKQAERSEQLVSQTRRVADSVAQAHGLQKQRTEAVEEMANQYRTQTRQMQAVAEAVEALPRAIKQQGDQLGQIRDQLEAQLEAQLSTAQGIQQLAGATDVIRTLADEQRRHVQQLQEANQAATLQVAEALDRQNRRFGWLLGLSFTVAVLAAAGAVVAVVLVMSRFK
ncbi:MAG: hypothetical protein PHU85_02375 [Phycisphaerae bacterium]|nr:hypothetical protein [Phycisphaerae bacterium]